MASIVRKVKKGNAYYYAVESKRVDGKPRIVWQKYLGTVDAILGRAEGTRPPVPSEAVIFEAGGVAALLRIAQRLELDEIISSHAPKRDQGPSVGRYMVLAALNRAMDPCSKLAIGHWYERTVLRRLWGFDPEAFSSQRFWDHMNRISQEAIEKIQEQLLMRVRERFGIDPRVMLYDTTNFFTYLATTNERAGLPRLGHSKQKRHDLRQVGLALLVTHDFQVPLFHRVYQGNLADVTVFADISRQLIHDYTTLCADTPQETTLVFDKGQICDEGMENLIIPNTHFVAALPANRFPELLAAGQLTDVVGLPGTRAFTTPGEFCATKVQFVTVYSESFFTQQLSGVTTNLVKCQRKLLDLSKTLEKWHQGKARGKKPTVKSVRASIDQILCAQFMKELFQTQLIEENKLPKLTYAVDHAALKKLSDERLGRTLLVTDRAEWSARETIQAYRSLSSIEDVFKNMKNIDFLHWQPAYHWTDQKLQVHGLYCVLAFLLAALARKIVCKAGIDLSLPAMLEELAAIREVAVIYPPGTLARPKDHITISRMTPRQRKLAEILQIAEVLKTG